jgi:enoyl-CoA hydratase
MKTLTTLLYEVKDGVAFITVNRPEALNALNSVVVEEMHDLFLEIRADDAVKAVILTGAGRSFVAGADIAQMRDMDTFELRRTALRGSALMNLIEDTEKPVAAAVNGFALGGGNELAMACDFRIASEKAKFGQPEVNLGIIPFFGGTQRLSRLVGKGMAKYLICSAEMIDAQEAYRIGLADRVFPAETLLEETEKFIRLVMTKSPIGVRMAITAINNGLNTDLKSGLVIETEAAVSTFCSQDRTEGMSAFLEKRAAAFQDK